jgi:hydrogenase maturation protease
MPSLREKLKSCLCGRACLIGVGNVNRGDDGFGVRLAEELDRAGVADVIVAGTNPENVVHRLTSEGYDAVVFLDAVDFGGTPGSAVLLGAAEIAARFPQVSTHTFSLGLLARTIEYDAKTKVWLLGVQPGSLRNTSQRTPAVQTTQALLYFLLRDALSCEVHA